MTAAPEKQNGDWATTIAINICKEYLIVLSSSLVEDIAQALRDERERAAKLVCAGCNQCLKTHKAADYDIWMHLAVKHGDGLYNEPCFAKAIRGGA